MAPRETLGIVREVSHLKSGVRVGCGGTGSLWLSQGTGDRSLGVSPPRVRAPLSPSSAPSPPGPAAPDLLGPSDLCWFTPKIFPSCRRSGWMGTADRTLPSQKTPAQLENPGASGTGRACFGDNPRQNWAAQPEQGLNAAGDPRELDFRGTWWGLGKF